MNGFPMVSLVGGYLGKSVKSSLRAAGSNGAGSTFVRFSETSLMSNLVPGVFVKPGLHFQHFKKAKFGEEKWERGCFTIREFC